MTTHQSTEATLLSRILDSSLRIAALDETLGAAKLGEEGSGLVLVITPEGSVGLREAAESLWGAVEVYHNIFRTLDLPPHAAPEDVGAWVREHASTIAAMCEGMSQEWDGRDMVGTLTAEARQAYKDLASATDELVPDLPRMVFAPEFMFQQVVDQLKNQETLEDAVALAEQWAREGETEHGMDVIMVVDYDLVRRYATEVWQEANAEDDGDE